MPMALPQMVVAVVVVVVVALRLATSSLQVAAVAAADKRWVILLGWLAEVSRLVIPDLLRQQPQQHDPTKAAAAARLRLVVPLARVPTVIMGVELAAAVLLGMVLTLARAVAAVMDTQESRYWGNYEICNYQR
jgi:hypothetical protein